jgi:hypothetical protein
MKNVKKRTKVNSQNMLSQQRHKQAISLMMHWAFAATVDSQSNSHSPTNVIRQRYSCIASQENREREQRSEARGKEIDP